MKKRPLKFVKMTGAGNDFLIFNNLEGDLEGINRSQLALKACRRNYGVGADGLVVLEKSQVGHIKWDFFNADGGSAEMCGNAARCVVRYGVENLDLPNKFQLETVSGLVSGEIVSRAMVKVQMPKPKIIEKDISLQIGKTEIPIRLIDTGVPHAVFETNDWEGEFLEDMGSTLRNSPAFSKYGGANGTFFEILEKGVVQSATFERGVEGITLACGTGAVAAALSAVIDGESSPVEVRVPGGTLVVETDSDFSFATLTGEARYICTGELNEEVML